MIFIVAAFPGIHEDAGRLVTAGQRSSWRLRVTIAAGAGIIRDRKVLTGGRGPSENEATGIHRNLKRV
jgi:hypothetical protein